MAKKKAAKKKSAKKKVAKITEHDPPYYETGLKYSKMNYKLRSSLERILPELSA
jgi:hypothetical protein